MSEKCTVLKFIDYDHVVVLYKGSPAIARIKSVKHNCRYSVSDDKAYFTDIYHINAPNNTVCDVELDEYYEKKYKQYVSTGTKSDSQKKYFIIASNIRVEN